jgi:GGDEF domain-containing protein
VFYFITRIEGIVADILAFRILIISLYIVVIFFPKKQWKLAHIIYYEIILAITIPYIFMYMLLYTDASLIWSTSLVFGAVIYAILSKTVIAVPVFFTAYGIIVFIYSRLEGYNDALMSDAGPVIMVALMSFVIACLLKIQLESTFHRHRDSIIDANKINETFSSLIYISSELAMYDDLDELYQMLGQRLNFLFPESSLALLITGEDYKILNQVYHDMTIEGQMFIKKNYAILIDPYAFRGISDGMAISQKDMSEFENWLVFNKDYSVRNIKGLKSYNISLFIKNNNITDLEMNAFQLFMEQIKGAIRTRFQALELERYATTDPLTRLFNRNLFLETFQECIDTYHVIEPFSIIFGDVNGLKRINDIYGHTSGDLLLKTCAETVRSVLSRDMKAFRYGGDEIIIILKKTSSEKAEDVKARLDAAFLDHTIIC